MTVAKLRAEDYNLSLCMNGIPHSSILLQLYQIQHGCVHVACMHAHCTWIYTELVQKMCRTCYTFCTSESVLG